jgi:hypothetical protein
MLIRFEQPKCIRPYRSGGEGEGEGKGDAGRAGWRARRLVMAAQAARCSSTGIDFDVGVPERSPMLSSGTSGLVSG